MFIFWWSCGLGDSKEHQIEGQGTEAVFLTQIRKFCQSSPLLNRDISLHAKASRDLHIEKLGVS